MDFNLFSSFGHLTGWMFSQSLIAARISCGSGSFSASCPPRGNRDSGVDFVAGPRMETAHIGLIADGEAIELGAVILPDVAGDSGIVFRQVRIGAGAYVQQAHQVDDSDAGGAGKREEVVDDLQRRGRRDTMLVGTGAVDRAATHADIPDADIAKKAISAD